MWLYYAYHSKNRPEYDTLDENPAPSEFSLVNFDVCVNVKIIIQHLILRFRFDVWAMVETMRLSRAEAFHIQAGTLEWHNNAKN